MLCSAAVKDEVGGSMKAIVKIEHVSWLQLVFSEPVFATPGWAWILRERDLQNKSRQLVEI